MNELEPLQPQLALLRDQLPRAAAPPGLKAKVWARLAASGVALAPSAAGATVGLAAKFGVWGLPLAVGALVAGAAVGVVLDRTVLAPQQTPAMRELNPAAPTEVPLPTPPPTPAPIAAPEPVSAQETPSTPARPRAAKVPPAPSVPAPTGEERQLIEAARTALLKRDPSAALLSLARHRASFSSGQLGEERDSLEVQALLQAGKRGEARDAALKFLKKFPESVFGPAVEAALVDGPN